MAWIQIGANIYGESGGDIWGSSLQLSGNGNYVISGSPDNDNGGNKSGSARIFYNNSGTWQQVG